MVNVWLLATTLILSAQVASGADDAGFEPYDCYRDLCVSRQQFCSDRERRCKYCLPGHCLNKNNTPKQCVPLCPGKYVHRTPPAARTHTLTQLMQRGKHSKKLVNWCFEPSQPLGITSGLKETFIKRYIVERTN